MLPCPHCGYDFLEFIKVNDLYENTDPFNPACKGSQAYNMPCQGPATVRFSPRSGSGGASTPKRLFFYFSLSAFFLNLPLLQKISYKKK